MKKLLNRKQKGFTIVELVIVIAVIGILAGVLIPVFINLNNKANKAADEALVKNLNTALATQEQEPGDTKNATFHDAVVDLKEYGYLLPNLVAKSDEALLWDRETNRFLLEEKAESDKTLDYWRIQNNLDEQKYNIYAGPKFNATSVTDLKVGFDAGDYEGLTSVSYVGNGVSHQDVVIRTNSANTNLTINAEHDTVDHYDSVGKVDAQKVDMNCYNEYGKAAYVKLSQGKVVAKAGGTISVVFATNSDASKVQVIKEKGIIEAAYTTTEAIATANKAAGGIELTYTVNNQPVTEDVVDTYAEAAVETNLIKEIEASGLFGARIGTVGYETLENAIDAVQKGQTIVVIKDIEKGSEYRTPGWNKGFNLDFNGHSFTTVYEGNPMWTTGCITFTDLQNGTSDDYSATISNAVLYSKNGNGLYVGAGQSICGVTLTVENCTVIQNGNNAGEKEHHAALRITERGKMIVNSGTYTGALYSLVVSNSGGEFTINGGTFNGSLYFSANTDSGVTKSYTINGGTFNSFAIVNPNKGTVTINGGTFDADPSAYVSSGHHAVNNGDGTWTVVAD